MKKVNKSKNIVDIEQLKQKAVEQFLKENESIEFSIKNTELTEKGSDKIVLIRDIEKTILAYYLLLPDGNLLKLNN